VLSQESLAVAHRTGAIATKDLERVAVDTTVQEKAIAHPTDARLTHRSIEKLVDLSKRESVELRQSYPYFNRCFRRRFGESPTGFRADGSARNRSL
jgi:hypothetical protein